MSRRTAVIIAAAAAIFLAAVLLTWPDKADAAPKPKGTVYAGNYISQVCEIGGDQVNWFNVYNKTGHKVRVVVRQQVDNMDETKQVLVMYPSPLSVTNVVTRFHYGAHVKVTWKHNVLMETTYANFCRGRTAA